MDDAKQLVRSWRVWFLLRSMSNGSDFRLQKGKLSTEYLAVNFCQWQGDIDRRKAYRYVQSFMTAWRPDAVLGQGEVLNKNSLLLDQYIVTQSRNCFVKVEFISPVVVAGGVGKHFDQGGWVRGRIWPTGGEQNLPTNHNHIRIGVEPAWCLQPEIATESAAPTLPESDTQQGEDVGSNVIVIDRGPGHREYFAIIILMFGAGTLFNREVIIQAVVSLWMPLHIKSHFSPWLGIFYCNIRAFQGVPQQLPS